MPKPVIIETFTDLIEHRYTLRFYCHGCNRSEDVDLAKMPPLAHYWGWTWRCKCGAKGMVTLTPPTLYSGGSIND